MCETGRDCSPVALWALVFNIFSSLLFIIIYIYLHVDYGVLCWYQHCGYLLVYFIGILDIVGGLFAISALMRGWQGSYANYTPGMFTLILASCFNCFIFHAFSDTLNLVLMQEYLRDFVHAFGESSGVLRDLQQTFGCCGITNYTDYPKGLVPDSCCLEIGCAQDPMNYNKRLGCATPPVPDSSGRISKRFTMKITMKGAAIYHCPYILLLTRTIVICIYRCGMLDIIANGIPIGFGANVCSPPPERCSRTLSIIERESRQSRLSGRSGSRLSSRADSSSPRDKFNIISPNVTLVTEPQPHIIGKPLRGANDWERQPSYIITEPLESESSQNQMYTFDNSKSKSSKSVVKQETSGDRSPGPEHKPSSVMHLSSPWHDIPNRSPAGGTNLNEIPKASPVVIPKVSHDTREASVISKVSHNKASPALPNSSYAVNPFPVAPVPKSSHTSVAHPWLKPEEDAKKAGKDHASVKPKDKDQ